MCITSIILYALPPTMSSSLGMPEKLLLLVECFTPSANLVIVVANQAGNEKGAAALSSGYMVQYLLFLPALLAGASLAIFVTVTSSQ